MLTVGIHNFWHDIIPDPESERNCAATRCSRRKNVGLNPLAAAGGNAYWHQNPGLYQLAYWSFQPVFYLSTATWRWWPGLNPCHFLFWSHVWLTHFSWAVNRAVNVTGEPLRTGSFFFSRRFINRLLCHHRITSLNIYILRWGYFVLLSKYSEGLIRPQLTHKPFRHSPQWLNLLIWRTRVTFRDGTLYED